MRKENSYFMSKANLLQRFVIMLFIIMLMVFKNALVR